jgi:hypothetical protein
MAETHFNEKVTRIYPERKGTYIALNAKLPYYFLPLEHENYDAIFSMVMSAAINGLILTIRITGGKFGDHELVEYVTIDFPA